MDPNVDLENLEISFSVASSEPFARYDEKRRMVFDEVLKISDDAIDLSRLNGGASVLRNHEPDHIVGVVVRSWISGGILCVRVRFRRNDEESEALFRDIVDGTVPNVSIGYLPIEVQYRKEEGRTVGEVVRWQPFEVSVAVGVPADQTVGFYRSFTINKMEKREMEEDGKEMEGGGKTVEELEAENKKLRERLAEMEETPKEEEKEVGAPKDDEKRSAVTPAVRAMSKPRQQVEVIDREPAYNLGAALRSLMGGREKADREWNISDRLFREAGQQPQTNSMMIQIPRGMFRTGEFTGGAGGGGASLIGTDHRPDMFVDLLRTRMACRVTTLGGLVGNQSIPKLTGSSTASWVSGVNSGAAANTKPTTGATELSPKKLTAYVDIGKDLLLQGTPDALNLVIGDLLEVIARKVDITILKGDSTAGIGGLTDEDDVQENVIATMPGTWADWTGFNGKIAKFSNVGTPYFIMSASDDATLRATSVDSGSGRFINESGRIDGREVAIQGELASGEVFYGDFSRIIMGRWGGLEIAIDASSRGNLILGQATVVASVYADFVVRNPNGFVKRVAA